MDARNERAAAIGVGTVARVWPNPDGTLGESDRQHMALCYAREAAAGGGALTPDHTYQHRHWATHHISYT